VTDCIQYLKYRLLEAQQEKVVLTADDLRVSLVRKYQFAARLGGLAGPYVCQRLMKAYHPFDERLKSPSGAFDTMKARFDDSSVVENEQVTRRE